MADVKEILKLCSEWATESKKELEISGVYVLGSLTRRYGKHFDPKASDLDLIVKIPPTKNTASLRKEWLEKFKELKVKLEKSLIEAVRPDAKKALASVTAVTDFEIRADVIKSGDRDYFRKRTFTSLLDRSEPSVPLLDEILIDIYDNHRKVLEFVQNKRKDYLAVSAGRKYVLKAWNKRDRLPVDIMRNAALATPDIIKIHKDRDDDYAEGLSSLTNYVLTHRDEGDLEYLNELIQDRTLDRGKKRTLSREDQIFLTEVIFDMAYQNFSYSKSNQNEASSKIDTAESTQHITNEQQRNKTISKNAPDHYDSRKITEKFTPPNETEVSKKNYIFSSMEDGLDSAMVLFKDFARKSDRIEALVICTDDIAEFLKIQPSDFFINKQITLLVIDENGECIAERESEIEQMGSRELSDYDIRAAIKQKLQVLDQFIVGPARDTITIKRYDLFPILEVWFFDYKTALFGLVQNDCSTRDQKFVLCASPSPLFSWLRRYYNYVEKKSQLDKNFHNRNKT